MKRSLTVLLLAFCSASAFAQQPGKWYAGLDIGQTTLDRSGTPAVSVDDTAVSYAVLAGYRFSRFFALEAGYMDFGEFGIQDSRSSSQGFMLNTRVIWPVARHFELDALLGGTWLSRDMSLGGSSFDASGFVPKLGIGFGVPVNEHLAFNFEWTQNLEWDLGFQTDPDFELFTEDTSTYSLGVRWRF
jgi:OOP family OmpA-OmpF porin